MASTSNFDDWPNDKGFDTNTEFREPVELITHGKIPEYCSGTLYRTGPGRRSIQTGSGNVFALDHWFDGFNQVHRFRLLYDSERGSMKVFYNSRHTVDALIERIRATGRLEGFSFGQKRDPCDSIFKKMKTMFSPVPSVQQVGSSGLNIGVSLSVNMPGIEASYKVQDASTEFRSLITKNDASTYQILDPESLEPMGLMPHTELHPALKGPLCSSHPRSDPRTGDTFNFNLEFGPQVTYRVFCVSASSSSTSILATITDAPPVYMHSFFLTERHVILCMWGSRFAYYGLQSLYTRNIVDALNPLDPSEPCRWYVIDRTASLKGVIGIYSSPAFFAFHTINAFEQESSVNLGEIDIIADVVCYDDQSIMRRFYFENLMSSSKTASQFVAGKAESTRSWLGRFLLPSISSSVPKSKGPREAVRLWGARKDQSLELPTMNPSYVTRRHRFVYGVTDYGRAALSDGLAKFDCETQTSIFWSERGQSTSEPIFVPDPSAGSDEEDKGTLLTIVLDGYKEKSYILALNAKTLKEVGRAEVDGVIGFGFHGIHLPNGTAGIERSVNGGPDVARVA
ncbi:MAG: hypothetical protein Q9227_008004 [Pyrenula ochraceoflavens]